MQHDQARDQQHDPYYFAPVIGINSGVDRGGERRVVQGRVRCGVSPLDVVLVLDRTGSMTAADVENVKNAALSILGFYNSQQQWVGPGRAAVRAGRRTSAHVNNPQTYPQIELHRLAGGAAQHGLHESRRHARTHPASIVQRDQLPRNERRQVTVTVNGTTRRRRPHQPRRPAGRRPSDARRAGTATVPDVIIFETDGQANQPKTLQPCNYFNTKANAAKAAGQTIFTIAYGLDSPPVKCDFDTAGPSSRQVRDHQSGGRRHEARPTTSPADAG